MEDLDTWSFGVFFENKTVEFEVEWWKYQKTRVIFGLAGFCCIFSLKNDPATISIWKKYWNFNVKNVNLEIFLDKGEKDPLEIKQTKNIIF